ncbi:MAG: hypothetical protein V7731_09175 [Amphritea sp.]
MKVINLCKFKEAASSVLTILEEDFQFSAEERGQALLLAIQILDDEELLGELEKA